MNDVHVPFLALGVLRVDTCSARNSCEYDIGNLSNMGTNGAEASVIVSEVSSFQRLRI